MNWLRLWRQLKKKEEAEEKEESSGRAAIGLIAETAAVIEEVEEEVVAVAVGDVPAVTHDPSRLPYGNRQPCLS